MYIFLIFYPQGKIPFWLWCKSNWNTRADYLKDIKSILRYKSFKCVWKCWHLQIFTIPNSRINISNYSSIAAPFKIIYSINFCCTFHTFFAIYMKSTDACPWNKRVIQMSIYFFCITFCWQKNSYRPLFLSSESYLL